MVSFSISLLGANELQSNIKNKLTPRIQAATTKAVEEAGFFLKREIEASIDGERDEPMSVDTGAYRDSISMEMQASVAVVSTDTPYAILLEEGTSKIEARHHFGNSVIRNKPQIVRFVADEVKTVL